MNFLLLALLFFCMDMVGMHQHPHMDQATINRLPQDVKNNNLRTAAFLGDECLIKMYIAADANPFVLNNYGFCALNYAIADYCNPDENRTEKNFIFDLLLSYPNIRNYCAHRPMGGSLLIDALHKKNDYVCSRLCAVGVNIFNFDLYNRMPYEYMCALLPEFSSYLYNNYQYYRDFCDNYYTNSGQSQSHQQPQQAVNTCPVYTQEDAGYLAELGIIFNPYYPPTPYQILGLSDGDSRTEINKAHKKLCLKWHPDRATDEQKALYTKVFQIISQAYDYINKLEQRPQAVNAALTLQNGVQISVRDVCAQDPEGVNACLKNKNITSLDGLIDAYRNKKWLALITLAGNNLTRLPANSFWSLDMHNLILKNNQISTIEPGAFNNAKVMLTFDLSNNLLDAGALANIIIPCLKKLDVSHNQIEAIDQRTLNGLRALEDLNLSYNRIANFHPLAVAHLNSLTRLDISGNPLTSDMNLAQFKKSHTLKRNLKLIYN